MTNKTPMPEPDAYIFQHEETGQIHEIDAQQVEWGFEKNNPRLKLIGSLYSSEKMEAYAIARVREALEQAVLQSPELLALRQDKERLDWLADPENSIGNVQLPIDCVKNNLHSLRGAIDEAMEKK